MNQYFEKIHAGLPVDDIEIIDFHAHLGPYFNMHIPWKTAERMVAMMDMCGIDKTVISPTPGLCSDLVYGNDQMLKAIRNHRGRLYGACAVNGNIPELSLDELDRCFGQERDVVLIKMHPFLATCRMDDRTMKPIYRFASERGLFIIVHTWIDQDAYGNLDIFSSVANDYPGIRWLMGHSGGPMASRRAVEIATMLPNVFLDLTVSMIPGRQIEFFVKEIGSERVMFGTDNPFIDPRPQIGRLCLADIEQKDRINIAGANARRYITFG